MIYAIESGITATLLHFPTCFLPPHSLGGRESSQREGPPGGKLQGLQLVLSCQCHSAWAVERLQSFCCLSEQLIDSLQL